ncbi:hypothetical protein CLAIMM_12855 [Cladophialophora immunda]|nr:hypothetical protein CLAIMM_12855 [Cladophialophora immunda]
MSSVNSPRPDPGMSRMQRVNRYLDQSYNFDHLYAEISSSEYHKYKQSELNQVLDILMTLFDSTPGSAVPTGPRRDPLREQPELAFVGARLQAT